MLRSLKHKKYRDINGRYIIEGEKTIKEALDFGAPVEKILASRESGLLSRAQAAGVETLAVKYDIIKQIADTKTPPQEIACVIKRDIPIDAQGRFFVALDGLADPKNVGGIIRTADAMGAAGVFTSAGSADFYGPKAQRAAMGSAFHIGVAPCDLKSKLVALKNDGVALVVGCLGGGGFSQGYGRVCLIIGNEARGVSEEIRSLCDELVEIEISGRAESLSAGVAAGIMMYEIRNRLKG